VFSASLRFLCQFFDEELAMAIKNDNPEFSRDAEDAEILQAVRLLLERAATKGITGIGPIDAEGATCKVLFNEQNDGAVPGSVEVMLSNKRNVAVKIIVVRDDTPAVLLSGPVPRPWQYSGPLMGGDPIWNDVASQWGTITFAAHAASAIEIEGNPCANQSVTCSHVLDFGGPAGVSTTRYPNSMKLNWVTKPPSGNRWIDVAGADMRPGASCSALEVRGLRAIKGVLQPTKGIRVSKYGATTGLTSGRDLGWTLRQLSPHDANFYWVRQVGGYFAKVGDSGAPVLDANRNLVGLVVSGKPGQKDETYYIQVLPKGEVPSESVTPNAIADLSYFVIDGF
jgi:hypothetical protein